VRRVLTLAATLALASACNQREPPHSDLPARAGSATAVPPAPADAAVAIPAPAVPAPAVPTAPTDADAGASAPPTTPDDAIPDDDTSRLDVVATGLPRDHYQVVHRDGDTYMITSTPPAHVYVDGRLTGVTPLMLRVAPGSHRVELRAADY